MFGAWDLDKEPPPEPFKYIGPPKFEYLIRKGGFAEGVDPPIKQQSLFPSLEDQVLDKIGYLLTKYKTIRARVRYICKRFDVDPSKGDRLYKKALSIFTHQLRYEHWIRNKDYFQWVSSEQGRQYLRNLSRWSAGRRAREIADFERKLKEGLEHVVSIDAHKAKDLLPVLDNVIWANMICSSPITFLIDQSGLTENDARILWANGYMRLVLGREETLFDHKFLTQEEFETRQAKRREEDIKRRAKCERCGKMLSYNEIGFATKLGQTGFCPTCLGADEEYVQSVARHYKSTGCQMFI